MIVGQTADYLPKGPIKTFVWSSHVTFGFFLAAVFVLRVVWRLTSGAILPPMEKGFLAGLAKTKHIALYALLLLVIGLGSERVHSRL